MANQGLIVEFWDVGQGDASVIRYGGNRVTLIDVGPRGSPIVQWLLYHPSIYLDTIVLTHNDADHAGCLSAVIEAKKFRIGTVYFLKDRHTKDKQFARLFSRLDNAYRNKEIADLRRLEAPHQIWNSADLRTSIEVKYPFIRDNLLAKNPNVTSGIVTLSVEGRVKVIWAGDSLIESVARECSGSHPDYLFGPHHGAPADRAATEAEGWLASIGAQVNLISVGSNNKYPHPQPSFIRKSLHAGSRVVCTQLTKLCDRSRKADVLNSHARLAIPRPNSGVGCRGPVRLTLRGGDLVGDELDAEHQWEILKLERPKCIQLRPQL